ncbi:MAG: hypothetical protein ACYTEW_21450 [Planctomycetota bacterium]|jgi:hypothetical protein
MATGGVELSKYEEYLFDQVRKGFWDEFSEYFFGLPLSGTRYTNEDRVEEYAVLHSLWGRAGRPEEELKLVGAEGQPMILSSCCPTATSFFRGPSVLSRVARRSSLLKEEQAQPKPQAQE